MPVNIISARLFSVARPRAAGGVGKRLLTDWRASPPDLDQVLVALDEPPARTINNAPDNRSFKDKWRVQIQGCVVAAALCAVITLIAMQWLMAFDAANPGDAVSAWRGGGGVILWTLAFSGCHRH